MICFYFFKHIKLVDKDKDYVLCIYLERAKSMGATTN